MYCPNCGAQLPDSSQFCNYCGARQPQAAGGPAPAGPQTNYRQPNTQQPYTRNQVYYQPAGTTEMPMKWHKFLVYFALWLSAVSYGYYGYGFLSGSVYQGYAESVYAYFPRLKAADLAVGAVMLFCAVLSVITAVRLRKLKAGAPKQLITLYVISAAAGLAYYFIMEKIVGGYAHAGSQLGTQIVSTLISVFMIIANRIYYKKRAHLFVN